MPETAGGHPLKPFGEVGIEADLTSLRLAVGFCGNSNPFDTHFGMHLVDDYLPLLSLRNRTLSSKPRNHLFDLTLRDDPVIAMRYVCEPCQAAMVTWARHLCTREDKSWENVKYPQLDATLHLCVQLELELFARLTMPDLM